MESRRTCWIDIDSYTVSVVIVLVLSEAVLVIAIDRRSARVIQFGQSALFPRHCILCLHRQILAWRVSLAGNICTNFEKCS